MKNKLLLLLLVNLRLAVQPANANVTLPHVLGDNMVLQRSQPVPVWGWAAPGEKITVEFSGQRKTAKTDAAGRWEVRLSALKASAQPAEMKISGANKITLTNILVGEVWLCSGQSNMEKPIGTQPGQKPTENYLQELAAADWPQIRLFKVPRTIATEPLTDVKSEWHVCSSNALEQTKFSAVAYFFAREIQQQLNVPIGLVESAWGGTRIEPWTPPVGFASVPKVANISIATLETNKPANARPTVIYNAMIAPLVPFALRGALWYQGEANCVGEHPDGAIYADKMEALVNGWRKIWAQNRLPFYYVQLAPFYYFQSGKLSVPTAEALPELWEAQTRALRIPDTGMTVITDLVNNLNDIHPVRKKEVGQRLALLALAKTYGQRGVVCEGPMFQSVKFESNRAVLAFNHADGGLVKKGDAALTWFTIAGADGKFVEAEAKIDGSKIMVSAASVAEPKAVRFAWSEGAQPNLFNAAGLPANPFRTDAPR